jgi:hypothetical protein
MLSGFIEYDELQILHSLIKYTETELITEVS